MSFNQGWTYQDTVKRDSAGKTVLNYYSDRYKHSTSSEWQQRIETGQILLNGKPTKPDIVLDLGQELVYQRPPWEEPAVPLSFETIYEDADIVVINKPSGLPVLPGGKFLEHTLLFLLQRLYPENTPIPIHRLGRGTSGLMLLARTKKAKSCLSQQMRDRKISKIYLAKAAGTISQDKFSISDRIGKIDHPYLGYIYGATPSGKEAYSKCQVIKRDNSYTIVEVNILTGRPHQIRIHLAAAGYPLLGDPLYLPGGIPLVDKERIITPSHCGYFLHAHRLSFIHPGTKQQISFACQPPASFNHGCSV